MEYSIDIILTDLAEKLIARKWKIVVAESCTGGVLQGNDQFARQFKLV